MTGRATADPLPLRPLSQADVEPLTDLWAAAWQAGHAGLVPEALTRLRTRENFRERILSAPEQYHLAGPVGATTAFIRLKEDELDQFHVQPAARGTGLAQRLMLAAEALMSARGTRRAWLVCAAGNARAARFCAKCGWRETGGQSYDVETGAGPFTLDVRRFEKDL
jgi:GNAT superfamily N-acetyltransferase